MVKATVFRVVLLAGIFLTSSTQASEAAWLLQADSDRDAGPKANRDGHVSMVEQLPAGSYSVIMPNLARLQADDQWRLPLPGGEMLSMQARTVLAHAGGSSTRHARGAGGAHAHLTVGPEGVFGHVGSKLGRFKILSDAGGSWLIHLDDPRIDVEDTCGTHAHAEAQPGVDAVDRGIVDLDQIDVAMLYSPPISERYPGTLIDTRLDHLLAIANQAMVDSEVDIVLRNVHRAEVPTPSSPDIFLALENMSFGLSGQPADVFTGLDQLRLDHGADLVIFVWPHDIETRGACGVAYLPRQDLKTLEWIDTLGVHVTNDGISNWSICSDAVMTHEFGHNLGSVHQRFSPKQEGFNFAHVIPDVLNTVMGSFGSADRNRYLRMSIFSNPNINCGGLPCGSMAPGEEANAALTLNDFSSIVASYADPVYSGTAARPAPSNPDSDGDDQSDWIDPFPFDPFNGEPPEPPLPPSFSVPPLFDGSQVDHYELLVASSGSDQVHSWHMDGSWQGAIIQVERLPYPDERPALSDFNRVLADQQGLIYMLASGSVRRFDRVSGAEFDIFLNSQPPFVSPGGLVDGFPRSMAFNPSQTQLIVLGNGNVQAFDDEANLLSFFSGLPVAADPTEADFNVRMRAVAIDSSENYYVVDEASSRVVRFDDPQFDQYSGDVVEAGNELIDDPWAMVLGLGELELDDSLYLANGDANNVLRINTNSGEVEVLIPAGTGGLDMARDLAFGPDGLLYVLSRDNAAVLRFNPDTGEYIDQFISAGHPGLDQPQSMNFVRRINAEIFRDRFEAP